FFRDPLKNLKRKPIGSHARDLLGEYLRRAAFWRYVKENDVPMEFAAEQVLGAKQRGVNRRRGQQGHKELSEAGGPWHWFVLKAIEGFKSSRIAPGRQTEGCPVADQFFTALAGGRDELDSLRSKALGGRYHASLEHVCEGLTGTEREVIQY